jgi:signal transduction histidine kinase/DNA-binding response OmpR family regulator
MKKFRIGLVNVAIVVLVVLTIVFYVFYQQKGDLEEACESFRTTTRVMEDVVSSDIQSAQKICESRVRYLNQNRMTLEEALVYVHQVQASEISMQIIRLDTMEGLSTNPDEQDEKEFPVSYADLDVIDVERIREEDSVYLTQSYANPVNGENVVSFCSLFWLLDEDGNDVEALMLRVVPVSTLEAQWMFSNYYTQGQMALLETDGDYVIRPDMLDGDSFYEFLESEDSRADLDAEALRAEIAEKDDGGFFGYDVNGDRTYFAFSHLRVYEDWVLVSCIPYDAFPDTRIDWTIPIIMIVALAIALVINVAYFGQLMKQRSEAQETMRQQLITIDQMAQEEKRQKELLRVALDQAESASRAKSNFLSNMSHDIRTPMNGIIGMTAIAGTHLDDPERVADCLQKITVASKHLMGLINEVLDMSKIESGKIDLSEEEFNLADLIDNLLLMIKPQVKAHGHEIVVNIHDVTHEKVIGDSLHLQQMFMNLMSNAIKYTPNGGRIVLTISEKPVNQAKVGCYEFIFEDNGIGMSEEFVKKIFEPFARAEDGRVSKIQGTGLGMAIVKNIARMMGGDIQVESRLNEGSKFTVTFFLKLQEESETSYEEFIDLPVLVADDDKMSCESACEILDELGMKSEWVLSGFEAVDRVKAHHAAEQDFFAVILDWKMPEMDGLAAAKAIRKEVGEEVPIIIISAYDWSEIEQEARSVGVNAFISKPLFKSRMVDLFNDLVIGEEEKKEEKDTSIAELEELELHGRRVLLVEDNELNSEIAKELLEMTGLEVECAWNGTEAVLKFEQSEEHFFDIVLMDIQMPVMNGYEAASAIRALKRGDAKTVPIIAMTANAFAEDVHNALQSGMNAHIAKPLDLNTLSKVLRKYITS